MLKIIGAKIARTSYSQSLSISDLCASQNPRLNLKSSASKTVFLFPGPLEGLKCT